MSGRDPAEQHRVATPLELLFDLTFVVAFGVAASQLAHLLAEGHVAAGLTGFAFATLLVCWAWVGFSWFASAYDTDDWVYRLLTMLQMVGVIILALGLPPMYASIDEGGHIDNRMVVAGYVVMRVALVALWLRAAKQDPARRSICLTYAVTLTAAQIGWIGIMIVDASLPVTFVLVGVMTVVELSGPWLVETRKGSAPWHAHHIAERYGLLTIIALGEGIVGTVASLSAEVTEEGWTMDAVLVAVAGVGLTFGMWWIYFVVPSSHLLHADRRRAIRFGYSHIPLFSAIVATGAGLHAAAYYIEHHSALSSVGTVLTVAIPVGVYIGSIFLLYTLLVSEWDSFHTLLLALTGAVLLGAVALAAAGVSMPVCLLIITLAPMVTILGFELVGHRHAEEVVGRRLAEGTP
ncbi:MAG: low temperature requirement protein A [Mycobacterium sp.]|nr:low temperature requirement protein A [Mycobacterium sp.]